MGLDLKTPSVSEQQLERVPEPPEVRNWKVNIYCIGVCFGALALGKLVLDSAVYTNLLAISSKEPEVHSFTQATMSLLWAER